MKRRVPQAVSLCLIAGLVFPGAQGFPTIAAESETVAEADGETGSGTSLSEGTGEDSETASVPAASAEEEDSEADAAAKDKADTDAEDTEDGNAESSAKADQEADTNEGEEDSVVGELIFAQCEDYVNVRTLPNTDSPVTAKLYNNDSATVVGISEDEEWYIVSSGNAYGYVKAEYFATGEEAEAIAEEVAYNVARVYADELNVRQEASTDSEVIDIAYENDEIEVVLYGEDWMKVALGNDVYGYVNSDYVEYVTYYPVGETLEEEEARLIAEAEAYAETEANTEAEAYVETEASAEAETFAETEAWAEPETTVDAETQVETEAAAEAETTAQTETAQTETTAQTEAAQTETTAQTEAAQTETAAQTEAAQTETAAQTEAAQTETAAQTEAAQTETAAQTEAAQTETAAQTEATQTETTAETESSSSASTGASIASFALQYVGYPYVYGGTSLTEGADCSGFVQTVFANFGIYLSRTAAAQSTNGTSVSTDSLQAGDLLFYSSTGDGTIDHVAIYIGGGSIVHAANETRGICTDSAYYSTIVCAVRCY